MKKYKVKEIFGPTIQGEGKGTGEVVLFLRLSGCNKWNGREEDKASSACPFCDTDFTGGDLLSGGEIVGALLKLPNAKQIKTLVISGGEPTLQLDKDLLYMLSQWWCVYLETNGSRELDEEMLQHLSHVSCSPKQSPDQTRIQRIDSLKILHPPETFDRSVDVFMEDEVFMNRHNNPKIYIQPVMDQNYEKNLKHCLDICYKYPKVRLSVQLHKTIEVK